MTKHSAVVALLALIFSVSIASGQTTVTPFVYRALPIGSWMVRGVLVPAVMLAFSALCLFIAGQGEILFVQLRTQRFAAGL